MIKHLAIANMKRGAEHARGFIYDGTAYPTDVGRARQELIRARTVRRDRIRAAYWAGFYAVVVREYGAAR